MLSIHFFYNATATTEIYTLSLHDALPIWTQWRLKKKELVASGVAEGPEVEPAGLILERLRWARRNGVWSVSKKARHSAWRSEEHTSELQSRPHLVCRLLLEKKKIKT